jgi:hypothetical protein
LLSYFMTWLNYLASHSEQKLRPCNVNIRRESQGCIHLLKIMKGEYKA